MKTIQLSGKYKEYATVVDDEVYEEAMKYCWNDVIIKYKRSL